MKKIIIKKSIFIFTFLLFIVYNNAQEMVVTDIPNLQQLPNSEVKCFLHDSEGFMWYGTEGGGLCRDDGYMVKIFRADINTPRLLDSNSITCITEDSSGKIWFGTKRGVYILDKKDYSITPISDQEVKGFVIKAIKATSNGSIWISINNYVYKFDSSGKKINRYEIEWKEQFSEVRNIYEDDKGIVWMMQWRGSMHRYDEIKDSLIAYRNWPFDVFPTCIVKDTTSPYYWIGTWGNGIVRFDPNEKDPDKMFIAQPQTYLNRPTASRRIYNIVQDSTKKNLWVTTTDNLQTYQISEDVSLQEVDISHILPDHRKISGNNIICDRLGNVWVADLYLNSVILSFIPNEHVKYLVKGLEKELDVPVYPTSITKEDEYFWIKQKHGRLYAYNPQTESLLTHKSNRLSTFFEEYPDSTGIHIVMNDSVILHVFHDGKTITSNAIWTLPANGDEKIRTLHNDNHNNLWIGTSYRLFRYDLNQSKLNTENENIGIINKIATSEEGEVYLATEASGFLRLSKGNVSYKYDSDENYLDLTITPDKNVWISSQSGNVYRYSPDTNSTDCMTQSCGLNGDIIYEIESDDEGNIWMLTTRKIIVYSPTKNTYNLIYSHNPSISFNNFLALRKSTDGKIFVAGTEGIIELNPRLQLCDNTETVEIRVSCTFMKVNNEIRIPTGKKNMIVLGPRERNLELFFSTFDPLNTGKIRYAFRYKDAGELWNFLPVQQNSIYLTRLTKGKHQIEVMATDPNGIWSVNTTTFIVNRLPAWYETNIAYFIYFLALMLAVVFVIEKYLKYRHEKNRKQMEEQIATMQYRFFTNISHELRTPLTLIITPLNNIIQKITDTKLKEQLEQINRNAQNILELFNQLLSFRKIEMKGEQLYLAKGDIRQLSFSVYENFKLIAEEKSINYEFHSIIDSYLLYFDAKKVKKVINNLLSNAFKFTDIGGSITLAINKERNKNRDYIIISITDTGKGIPEKEIPRIFDRFYQAENQSNNTIGSGIGLHLAKEYVHLHEGRLTVQSETNVGSTFSIYIPTDLKPQSEEILSEKSQNVAIKSTVLQPDLSKKILIVEDNDEFRSYLKAELSQYFTVFEASDGNKGEMEAIDKEPDMIITDLMMPGINGIELCKRIKNNLEISHIPVILLTANNDIEFEKQGYKEGADAYISKPFLWEILLSRIDNLMKQVAQRKQSLEKKVEIDPEQVTISKADEAFLTKTIALVEKNLNNAEYSVEDFSQDMCMSRANLYRKIHSITGLTPSEFIRNMRLKKAAELIKEGELSVVEIAEKVGFSTHSHFTKTFKEMFGLPPIEYQKRFKI